MYDEINEKLTLARQGIDRLHKLDAMIAQLETELGPLRQKEALLKALLEKEQLDVEKLENRSLSAVLFSILGSLDKHIEKEHQEALAAKLKYDQALRALEDTEYKLSSLQNERPRYAACQADYARLFAEKKALLMRDNAETAQEIMALMEKISDVKSRIRETQEAIVAGNNVLDSLKDVMDSLDSAANWGTWDMLGGGLISDLAKHSKLDSAKYEIERTQRLLLDFNTELADVKIRSDIGIHTDGFAKFADFFFDGLFADWNMQNKINGSRDSVYTVLRQVESVLGKLGEMQVSDEGGITQLEAALDTLIARA